jgi:predicted RNase H-like HicB family nuclease
MENGTKIQQASREPLEHYFNLRYPITIYPEADGGYVAMIKDLPGCIAQGETPDEIMANIEEARQLWIETVYEHGDEIPLPSDDLA